MSWNILPHSQQPHPLVSLFVRLWVEIISIEPMQSPTRPVSLFVRLWVEITLFFARGFSHQVSLFVRLWVEIPRLSRNFWTDNCQPLREAVSWNAAAPYGRFLYMGSQPLREAVSWNIEITYNVTEQVVSLFVRLWVEILLILVILETNYCQPLREAVSWNVNSINTELANCGQPLREAVSWNFYSLMTISVNLMSASSWGCELKC